MKKLLIAALALTIGSCMSVTFAAEAKTLEQAHRSHVAKRAKTAMSLNTSACNATVTMTN